MSFIAQMGLMMFLMGLAGFFLLNWLLSRELRKSR